jgi:hypothetical protein
MCPDNAAPGNLAGARRVWGGKGKGGGKVVEQQTGALGNPCSSFSLSSSSLCIRRGFDKIFTLGNAVQRHSRIFFKRKYPYISVYGVF